MNDWLRWYCNPVPGDEHAGHRDHGSHETMPLPGMAMAGQLDALRAVTGAEFDRQFLDLVIAHHQGALTVAERQLSGGVETQAQELAKT
jgi:uncharacterized protein (DUF305 family)